MIPEKEQKNYIQGPGQKNDAATLYAAWAARNDIFNELEKDSRLQNSGIDVPRCPINDLPFVNPVKAADGHTYERHAIEAHFNNCNIKKVAYTSPKDGNEMPDNSCVLRTDYSMRDAMDCARASARQMIKMKATNEEAQSKEAALNAILQQFNDILKTQGAELKTQEEALKTQGAELKTQEEALKTQGAELKTQGAELKQEKEKRIKAEKQISKAEEQIIKAEKQISKLTEANEQYKADRKSLGLANENLTNKNKSLKQQVEILTIKVEELEKKLNIIGEHQVITDEKIEEIHKHFERYDNLKFDAALIKAQTKNSWYINIGLTGFVFIQTSILALIDLRDQCKWMGKCPSLKISNAALIPIGIMSIVALYGLSSTAFYSYTWFKQKQLMQRMNDIATRCYENGEFMKTQGTEYMKECQRSWDLLCKLFNPAVQFVSGLLMYLYFSPLSKIKEQIEIWREEKVSVEKQVSFVQNVGDPSCTEKEITDTDCHKEISFILLNGRAPTSKELELKHTMLGDDYIDEVNAQIQNSKTNAKGTNKDQVLGITRHAINFVTNAVHNQEPDILLALPTAFFACAEVARVHIKNGNKNLER